MNKQQKINSLEVTQGDVSPMKGTNATPRMNSQMGLPMAKKPMQDPEVMKQLKMQIKQKL